jgi:membrane associated rhomboid family serine protease
MPNKGWQELKNEWQKAISIGIALLAILWSVFIIDSLFLGGSLKIHGIRPRQLNGLPGILFGPFFHGSIFHIFNNSIGIVLLGTIILLRGIAKFIFVTLVSMLIAGTGIWLIGGSGTNHIGYSGIIFGYFGYLLLTGIFDKKLGSIFISIFTVTLYGGMIFGVLPTHAGISWEGHLFGFIGGVISAFILSKMQPGQARLHFH